MGKIVVSQFTTVDGVIEDPGGNEKAPGGGWAFKFNRGEDGDKFKLDELMESDALLLGRKTWEGFAAAWPSRKDDAGFADKFNSMRKYVVTSTLENPDWENSVVVGLDEIAGLRDRHEGNILVNGSAQLVHALADMDVVDEWRMMVFPTVVGQGKRMFGAVSAPKSLRLASSQPVGDDGVVVLTYLPAG